jgi:transposase-like protein
MTEDLVCSKCGSTDIQGESVRGEGRRWWCQTCNHGSWEKRTFQRKKPKA